MINKLLVAATAKAVEELLDEKEVAYKVKKDKEMKYFEEVWDNATKKDKDLTLRQARPAVKRILSLEPYAFKGDGSPLIIRFNYLNRKLEKDSFGELLLERVDLDWHISISVKYDATVMASMKVAERTRYTKKNKVVNVFNEIDDFGERIFSVPCSNEYFQEMNDILLEFEPYKREEWLEKLKEEDFLYGKLITPMLTVMGRELPRICEFHPEVPRKLFDYFYGNYDYYYINPITQVKKTRIGAINPHGGLGKIPRSHNLNVPRIKYPTQLLDVRFATGPFGELSKDTIQFTFDHGWALCIRLFLEEENVDERNFGMKVYLPSTPYGSYRDQVDWE